MFSLIAAVDSCFGIAKEGRIPWDHPEDMAYFKKMTSGHVVIMGNKTWASLPQSYRPLPNRVNVVLSNSGDVGDRRPDLIFKSINDCVGYFSDNKKLYAGKTKFVIGGANIYQQFLDLCLVHELYITHVVGDYGCDLFLNSVMNKTTDGGLPGLLDGGIVRQTANPNLNFHKYYVVNHEEANMLWLMRHILENGVRRDDRTGVGTLSVFSRELRFDLRTGRFPLMTTRPVSLRIVFEELMWILRGQTDNKILNAKGIKIWDDNTTREFLDKGGLERYAVGDVGASYGFQMRHFGETYAGCGAKYKGFDQLENAISLIKYNPDSRRIIINLWNPAQLGDMALPPCLYGYQFYVANGRLSCKLIQRSSDIALAGGHNCAAGALLTIMMCAVTNLTPGELIWSPADIHIYTNQTDTVREQLSRVPKPFPFLNLIKMPKDMNIRNFEFDHFKLINYEPHPRIKFAMNA